MTTLEERVSILENRIAGLITSKELDALETRMESRLYTVRDELKGQLIRAIEISEARIQEQLTASHGWAVDQITSVREDIRKILELIERVLTMVQNLPEGTAA